MNRTLIRPTSAQQRTQPWRVIIQIPCLNEEETLPDVLRDMPVSTAEVCYERWWLMMARQIARSR